LVLDTRSKGLFSALMVDPANRWSAYGYLEIPIRPALSILFLAITSTCLVWAELPDPCKDNHAELARLTEGSAIYAESQDLAQTLCNRGFQVNSTQRSKEEELFEEKKGCGLIQHGQRPFEV